MEVYADTHEIRSFYKDRHATGENSGFDLVVPEDVVCKPGEVTFIKHGMHARRYHATYIPSARGCTVVSDPRPGFFLMARSSISKTPLMLANGVGLIDGGYTGDLIAAVRNVSNEPYVVQKGTRLVQIVLPSASPFRIFWLDKPFEEDRVIRGPSGFGSTDA
jgi:dUTP pyrophosphatase